MRKALTLILILLPLELLLSVVPTGYYAGIEGKKGAVLKTALHNIICQDTTHYLGYGSGAGKTWEGFYATDRNLSTNAVIDMYSDSVRYFPNPNPTFVSFGQTIHIEHSLPKSWWGCDINHPDCPAKDLHHIYPADGSVNTSKNDNPLGVVTGTPTFNNGVSKVGNATYNGYSGLVFEPVDQYKGDFARSYFYMATAYEHYVNKWDTTKPENMMEHNKYPVFKTWAQELLLQWYRQDTVSTKEKTRNEVVFGIQQNRNPFIDYPQLVEYIWGNKSTIPFRFDGRTDIPYVAYPNSEDSVVFGKVYAQQTGQKSLSLKGMNLSGNLSLSISGPDAACFSLASATIGQTTAENGCTIPIEFASSTFGIKNARLKIYGGGIDTVSVILQANSSDDFVALPANSVTANSFTAHWTASPGATAYSLDVYRLQPNGTINYYTKLTQDFSLALPNTWSKDGYVENTSGSVRLASTNQYGKLTPPAFSTADYPTLLTVKAKQYSNDNGAQLTVTLDNQPLTVWTTGTAYQNFTVLIPKNSSTSSVLALSAIAGKRVYIDELKAEDVDTVYAPVSVGIFPVTVNNTLSYPVIGLTPGEQYYYKVTPVGNGLPPTNAISVSTSGPVTMVNTGNLTGIRCEKTMTGYALHGLLPGDKVLLTDGVGRKPVQQTVLSTEFVLKCPAKGVYLLTVQRENKHHTYKLIQ